MDHSTAILLILMAFGPNSGHDSGLKGKVPPQTAPEIQHLSPECTEGDENRPHYAIIRTPKLQPEKNVPDGSRPPAESPFES